MNQTILTIFERSSIRAYTNEPLTKQELELLAKCAIASPTARNIQSRRFYFITTKELISEIERETANVIHESNDTEASARLRARNDKVIYDAPLLVVIAVDKNSIYSAVDAGIATATLCLAAKSMGLESVILGMPRLAFNAKNDYFKARLGIPLELDFEIAVAIGHGAVAKEPHEGDLSHVVVVDA